MRYQAIDPELFIINRRRLVEKLPLDSIAIVAANRVEHRTGDTDYPFRQSSNFFWLTGLEEPEAALLLAPSHSGRDWREVLFIKEATDRERLWDGAQTSSQLSKRSGIKHTLPLTKLDEAIKQLMGQSREVCVDTPPYTNQQRAAWSLKRRLQRRYPKATYQNINRLIVPLRIIKTPAEIKLIKQAIKITDAGLKNARQVLKPGVREFEIEAALTTGYAAAGATHAFDPTVAAGRHACTIHYVENSGMAKAGDAVLVDTGAEYANYAADISRTWPVSGKFSPRQQAVYEAVKAVQQAAIKLLQSGQNYLEFERAVNKLVWEGLGKLNLLKPADYRDKASKQAALRRYYPHAASHFLGLDVHDVGNRNVPLAAGMVVTCEPGIYIEAEGIGVRLENDILITKAGPVDLTANVIY